MSRTRCLGPLCARRNRPVQKRSRLHHLGAALALAAAMGASGAARAQTTIAISMTQPPAAPRLGNPFTFGAVPAKPLLFAIPATGQAPLTFAATGLPAGVTIAASTGILSG